MSINKQRGIPPEITDSGYIVYGASCGRNKDGKFVCVCGKCVPKPTGQVSTRQPR